MARLLLQVEQNLHPSLKGKPFAIQQHQDIIAVRRCAHILSDLCKQSLEYL